MRQDPGHLNSKAEPVKKNCDFVRKLTTLTGALSRVGLAAQVCQFNESAFTKGHFRKYGITLPDSLRNSVDKRQAHFLAGRIAAAGCLAQLGTTQNNVGYGQDRAPIWPAGVCGSISHTKGLAVGVCARRETVYGVGIDVETLGNQANQDAIVPIAVTEEEIAVFNKKAEQLTDPQQAALIIFSAKEALYKALYPTLGIFIDYLDVALNAYDPENCTLHIRLTRHLSAAFPVGRILEVDWSMIEGRVASLCLLRKNKS